MGTNGDVAEQMTRFYLEGCEVVAKVSGKAVEHTIAVILNILKSKEQTKGKARLNTMLKSGKPLSVFTIRNQDLEKFTKEAKRYGVLYSALVSKNFKSSDGVVDIMVRDEDASKINRIVERFNIALPNATKIKTEEIRNISEKLKDSNVATDKLRDESRNEILQALEEKNKANLKEEELDIANFQKAKTESPQSEPSSIKEKGETDRKSVKKKLETIKKEMEKEKLQKDKVNKKTKTKTKNKKLNKEKSAR